jgi:hypothetical protein
MANKTFWKGAWHLVVQQDPADERGRLGIPCPMFQEGDDVKWIAAGAYGASGHFIRALDSSRPVRALPRTGSRVYKVVTESDPWFAGAFHPGRLEAYLNELGADGWHVVGVTSTARGSAVGAPDTSVGRDVAIILERVVDEGYLSEERRRRGEALSPAPDLPRS